MIIISLLCKPFQPPTHRTALSDSSVAKEVHGPYLERAEYLLVIEVSLNRLENRDATLLRNRRLAYLHQQTWKKLGSLDSEYTFPDYQIAAT